MEKRATLTLILVLMLFGLVPATAWAACPHPAVSAIENALYNLYACDASYRAWQIGAYNEGGSCPGDTGDWGGGRGFCNQCSRTLEFPLQYNAAFLITYGLMDNAAKQYHGTSDYRMLAERWNTDYHAALHYHIDDTNDFMGEYNQHIGFEDDITIGCQQYSDQVEAVDRAATFVHEGWHAWQSKYDRDSEHWDAPRGLCGKDPNIVAPGTEACDTFYLHTFAGQHGQMYRRVFMGDTPVMYHSANQAGDEFLCDVVLGGNPAIVSAGMVLAAKTVYAIDATNFYVNTPPKFCSNPRPF